MIRVKMTAVLLCSGVLLGCSDGGGSSSGRVPAVPQGLTVTAAGDAQVSLNWQSTTRTVSYNLYVAPVSLDVLDGSASNYASIDGARMLETEDTSLTVTGLTNDQLMFFAVTSENTVGESRLSGIVVGSAVMPRSTVTLALNDTGIQISGRTDTDGNEASCVSGDLKQDCDLDNGAPGGIDGFDFTRLAADGTPAATEATSWACVKDNRTGLIWAVKQASGAHTTTDQFHWYDQNVLTNAGDVGSLNEQGDSCDGYQSDAAASWCHTQAYQVRTNTEVLCGLQNWRLPELDELKNILHYGKAAPMIVEQFFPHTQSDRYWSATPNVLFGDNAWAVDFATGKAVFLKKNSPQRVRLVSYGKQEVQP